MNIYLLTGLAALVVLGGTGPGAAHNGVAHGGCPVGQSFTAGDLTITGVYTRATPPGATAAGVFLTITNAGAGGDLLTSVQSDAGHVEMHETMVKDGVAAMTPIEGGLSVPPNGGVELVPGGRHLMVTGLRHELHEGECLRLQLVFGGAGPLDIEASVGGLGQSEPVTKPRRP